MSVIIKSGILEEVPYLRSSILIISRMCSSEFKTLFDSEEKRKCIDRLRKFKIHHNPNNITSQRNASVLIPLCHVNDELSLLYTLRKQHLRVHKGQVSFPGGKQDYEDSNLEVTALRETEEELGIPQSSVDVWGHGNAIVAREFNIHPVVGYLGKIDLNNLKPNPSEVDYAFSVALKHFCNPINCRYTQYREGVGYTLPVYINGKCKIWGITAVITHAVLRALIPKRYKHDLHFIKPVAC